MPDDALACPFEVLHPLPQFALNAAAFFLAHLRQSLKRFLHLGKNSLIEVVAFRKGSGFKYPRHPHDGVEIQFGVDLKLGRSRAKGLHIAGNDLPVESKSSVIASLEAEGKLDVTASQPFLKNAPQLHLQSITVGGHAEMEIQEPVIDRFQGQRKANMAVESALGLRETGH